jgi:hypothetical protein
MPHDMLVKLYNIEDDWSFIKDQKKKGIAIKRAIGPEKSIVVNWAGDYFSEVWKNEADVSFSNNPISCFVAVRDARMIGFACYDTTKLGFFGPTGVAEECRGLGTGKALLMACMLDMKLKGYGYAAIGAVGPAKFYEKAVGAVIIPDSWPGVYADLLKKS